jgi:glucokinase
MKYYVGVDVGGTNIVAGVVDEKYNILSRCSVKTLGFERSFETVVADIASVANDAVQKAGLCMDEISSIGLGTPSCVNPKTRLLVHANNLGWHNVPLYDELGKHLKKPLFIKNDADCAALGEVLVGCRGEYKDALMITLGTGVGGGMVINGKIFNGCDHMGAEMGHTKLVYDGLLCTCGQKGCFESYGSATALIAQTKEAIRQNPAGKMYEMCGGDMGKIDGKLAFSAARQGDAAAMRVVDQYISYVAAGLSTLIAIFRPEIIIIGGGIGGEGEFLLGPLNKRIHELTFAADEVGVPRAIAAKMGNDAGIIGAAMLELQQ